MTMCVHVTEVAMAIEDDVISTESDSSPNTSEYWLYYNIALFVAESTTAVFATIYIYYVSVSYDVAVSSGSDEAMDEGSTPESTTNSPTDEANSGGRQMSHQMLQRGRYDNSWAILNVET